MAHNLIPWSPCYCDVCQLGHAKIIEAARRFWQLKDRPSVEPCKHRIIGACELCVYDLRVQLADAKAVIEAAREAERQLSGANLALWASGEAEEEELAEANEAAQELRARLADYDAKHGGTK